MILDSRAVFFGLTITGSFLFPIIFGKSNDEFQMKIESADNILHFIPEFEDDILSQQHNFEHQDEMTFSSMINLRHTRQLNAKELNNCVGYAIAMRNKSTVLKGTKPNTASCTGFNTKYGYCTRRWSKSDWPNHESTCHSLQGVVVRYDQVSVRCTARHSNRQNGAKLTDRHYYNYMPLCFPTTGCADSLSRDICSLYADHMARVLTSNLYKRTGYYDVACSASRPSNCEIISEGSNSNTLTIVLATTIPLGLLLLFCACFFARKKTMANKETKNPSEEVVESEEAVESETKINQKYFGICKGLLRDRHPLHWILYLANIIWIVVWIIMSSSECKWKKRRSSECDSRDPTWFWKNSNMLFFQIFIFAILYVMFIVEFWNSSTRKYLRNIDTTESLLQIMDRLYKQEPTLSLTVNCFHMESRTVTYYDHKGNSQTRIESYPVSTYSETEEVNISSWEDISSPLKNDEVSAYLITKVKISKSYVAQGNHNAQCEALRSRNQHRDVMCNVISHYHVAGLKDGEKAEKMLVFVDLAKRPALMTYNWSLFFHLTLIGAFPFRLWMSSITGMIETTVEKSLQTSWEGNQKKE